MRKRLLLVLSSESRRFIKVGEWAKIKFRLHLHDSTFGSQKTKDTFLQFIEILSRTNLSYWITNGTLLGIVRNGEIIDWDNDADFQLFPKSDLEKVKNFISELREKNFIIVLDLSSPYIKFNAFKDGVKFSVGETYEFFDWYISPFVRTPKTFIGIPLERQEFDYRNVKLFLPRYPVKLLEYYYKDWKTPIKSDEVSDFGGAKCENGVILRRFIKLVMFMQFRTRRKLSSFFYNNL